MSEGRYFIRDDYTERLDPHYFPDADAYGQVSQPDVYPHALRVAERAKLRRVVDLGCGQGAKLDPFAALHPDWIIVGVDYGLNLAAARDARPWGIWVEANLEQADRWRLRPLLRDALVICADVIEHLVDPYPLLRLLRLSAFAALVLSTPERELTWGGDHTGPPPNECHVREWSVHEFGLLLQHVGFREVAFATTRDSDQSDDQHTILATIGGTR